MQQTPVRPYRDAGKIEFYSQHALPRILHFLLFGLIGTVSLLAAVLINGILVVGIGLSYVWAYTIVVPIQLLINFAVARRVLFGARREGFIGQVLIFLPSALVLRLLDWIMYVVLIQQTEHYFILIQCFNAVFLLCIRYFFVKRVVSDAPVSASVELQNQDGIIIGNLTNKSELKNPLAKKMVAGFNAMLLRQLGAAHPTEIHEVGCGEGRLAKLVNEEFDLTYRGSDFSREMVKIAKERSIPNATFKEVSIYDLDPENDGADTVVCCEVLEHLEYPDQGLIALKSLGARQYVLSVPREPLWRLLNLARFKYAYDYGNTPGHLNHWSSNSFRKLLESHGFVIESMNQPIPWTMVRGYFSTNQTLIDKTR